VQRLTAARLEILEKLTTHLLPYEEYAEEVGKAKMLAWVSGEVCADVERELKSSINKGER
jgi:hypothetical protein